MAHTSWPETIVLPSQNSVGQHGTLVPELGARIVVVNVCWVLLVLLAGAKHPARQ